jgi:hypothetical protein
MSAQLNGINERLKKMDPKVDPISNNVKDLKVILKREIKGEVKAMEKKL